MTVCLSLFIPINRPTILASIAIVGGLYYFFLGFHLLARKRSLLATPTSKIHSAAPGLVEVSGVATGPYTMPAPITGQPCFLCRTTAWQQRDGRKGWTKVAEETLHLPFFIDDSTGQLLVEPLGADLDLRPDFREEYHASLLSLNLLPLNLEDFPPRVSAFLSRHGIVRGRRFRIEESSIKPDDPLFAAGTFTENPGVQVRPFSARREMHTNELHTNGSPGDSSNKPATNFSQQSSEQSPAPEIIRLENGETPAGSREMSQQAKIAAALTRAGIAKPEAWSAAGVPYQTVSAGLAVGVTDEEDAPSATRSAYSEVRLHEVRMREASPDDARQNDDRPNDDQSAPTGFNLTPPVVLMKDANDSTFVISFRSQKEFVSALAWKSASMIWGGAASTLLGVCVLLAQMKLL